MVSLGSCESDFSCHRIKKFARKNKSLLGMYIYMYVYLFKIISDI